MSGRDGFTLTEILVALLVAMFGIIPLLNLNTLSRRRGQQGETYALAQLEAERLAGHFAESLGFEDLDGRLSGNSQVVLDENDPDVQAVLSAGTGLDQAARLVKRHVRLLRCESGLIRVTALVQWQSTAPVENLQFQMDRFVANHRVSMAVHFPFSMHAAAEPCP